MDEHRVYKCELCGTHVMAVLAHFEGVGDKRRAFCSADHRMEWLELEHATAAERPKRPTRASRR